MVVYGLPCGPASQGETFLFTLVCFWFSPCVCRLGWGLLCRCICIYSSVF